MTSRWTDRGDDDLRPAGFTALQGRLPPRSQAPPAPLQAVNPTTALADDISTLAADSYPSSTLGVSVSATGMIEIYAVPSADSAFLSAVTTLNTEALPFTVNDVTYSLSSLDSTMATFMCRRGGLE